MAEDENSLTLSISALQNALSNLEEGEKRRILESNKKTLDRHRSGGVSAALNGTPRKRDPSPRPILSPSMKKTMSAPPPLMSPPGKAANHPNHSRRRRKKHDPTTFGRRAKSPPPMKPFQLENAAKILRAEAGSPLPPPMLQQVTSNEMRQKYRQQRNNLRRAFTCISSSKAPPENDFIMQNLMESDESDYEDEADDHTRRHRRAMTVQYDMKEDPDMKSTYEILALRPMMTGRDISIAMDNAPDLIQYDMDFNLNDEEESEFAQLERHIEDELKPMELNPAELIPEVPDLKGMKNIIVSDHKLVNDERIEKMLVTRKKLIEELVSSERVFLNQVVCLFTKFSEPLRAGLVNDTDHQTLFPSSLMDIHVFSANLLRDLDKLLKCDFDNLKTRLSDKLMDYAEKLHESFAEYACHYEDITHKAKELQAKKKHISDILNPDGMSFFSLAIVPVQRPSRYLLLLKGILDHTPESHIDYFDLKEVKHRFSKANDEINETLRSFGEKKKVQKIAKKTKRKRIQDRASRLLIKRGAITLVDDAFLSKRQHELEVYLFNDLLIGGAFQSKKKGGIMASIFSAGKETDFVTMVEIKIDESFLVENLPNSFDPEISNAVLVRSKEQSVILSFNSKREKTSWQSAFKKCGTFGVVEDTASDYDGPWAPPLMPSWWSSECVSCKDSLKRKKANAHCIQCGSRMCLTCHANSDRCTPCKDLFSSDPRHVNSPRPSSQLEVGVAATIWGYPRNAVLDNDWSRRESNDPTQLYTELQVITADPRATSPQLPQIKKLRRSFRQDKRHSVPYGAIPLPNLKKTDLKLSILFSERTESAHDIIRRVLRKSFPHYDLDPLDFGLELLDFPRQYIVGRTALNRYHIFKVMNERVNVRIRNKTFLIFLNKALIAVNVKRKEDIPSIAMMGPQKTRHILPIPTSFSDTEFDPDANSYTDGSILIEE